MKMSLKKSFGEQSKPISCGTQGAGSSIMLSRLLLLKMRKKHIMLIEVDIELIEENILMAVEIKGVMVSVMVEEMAMVEEVAMMEEVVMMVMTEVAMVVE